MDVKRMMDGDAIQNAQKTYNLAPGQWLATRPNKIKRVVIMFNNIAD